MQSKSNRAFYAVVKPCLLVSAAIFAVGIKTSIAEVAQTATQNPEEMVVVGSRLPIEPYKVGRSISVLDQQQIDDIGYQYGADLFRFVPGLAVNRSGGYGGVTALRIRGAEGNHTLVLIDGIDVSKTQTGEFDISSLLSSDIERIEVLRGPQSGLYGSNAIGGVINIVTRSPEQGFALDAELEAGENDTGHGSISVSGGTETLRGRLTYTQRRSEFNLAETGREDDEDENRTLNGRLLFDPADNLSIEVFGRFTEKDSDTDAQDFSGGPQQGTLVDDNSFTNTEDLSIGALATLRLADGRSITRLSMARTDTELDGGFFGNEGERDDIRFDTSWQWQAGQALEQRTTLFLQWEDESFRNTVPVFDPSQAPTQDRKLFGFGLEHQIALNDALFINANVRRDENDDFDDSTAYAIDVSYRLLEAGTRLHASYGKAVTNPDFFEQFGFIPGFFVGNPDLTPEESRGWDAGVEQAFFDNSLVVDITYFDADLTDEIQAAFPTVVNANGESDRSGVELSASWMPTRATSIAASYTYTDAEEPGGEEVRRPEHMASLSVAQALLDNRLRLAAGLVYNGEMLDNDFRNGFPAQRTELDSYTLVNINASYNITDALQVFARVENLFDEDYQENIGYATPGRAAYTGVRYRFGN